MKVLIDIDEDEYDFLTTCPYPKNIFNVTLAIVNGTPIPEEASNGDVIQMLFPKIDTNFSNVIDLNLWWNAQYQKGDGE